MVNIWDRVPLTPAPEDVTIQQLRDLTQPQLETLVRANLFPIKPRKAWDRLWRALQVDDVLRDRAFDALDKWQDAADEALEGGVDDADEAATIRKFLNRCEEARSRLSRDDIDEPLAWAGSATAFQPHARRVIAQLVGAIATHRSTIGAGNGDDVDQELWRILRKVDLDPADYLPS